MSLKASEKVETNVWKLDVEVDGKTFDDAVNKVYNRQKKNISVPGFRKGKATRGMIERYYGEGVFYDEALNMVFPDAVDEAAKEAGLELVDNPFDVEITEAGKDGVKMTMKVTVKPEIELDDYKGLKIERPDDTVSDEDVDKEIESMRERGARYEEADRPAELNDLVIIDFEGFVDDVAFDGGKGEGYELELGSGQFIPGFEDQIVGHKAGEEFDINVKFPEEYTEELAGKDAVFKTVLHHIKKKELPEVDDDFAADLGYDSVDDMNAKTRETLEDSKKQMADADVDNEIFRQIAGLVKGEIPDVMIENQIDEAVNEFGYQLQAQGMDLNTYMQYTGLEEAQIRDSFRTRSENQVKCRLALEKISELEKIEVSEADIDQKFKDLAEEYGMEEENIRKFLRPEDVSKDIMTTKALDVVKDAAVISQAKPEKKAPAKKAPAKKAAAKKDDADAEKKPAAKKAPAKKAPAKKAAAKKEDAEAGEKPAAKKAPAKKAPAKKTPAKKADAE